MDIIKATPNIRVSFTELIDLANEQVGGEVLFTNDDFFAEKENLLKNEAAIFVPDKYTEKGKWMDGWESRRKRTTGYDQGYDHCIVKLGLPGEIHGLNIDTSFFTGNHPESASVEAIEADAGTPLAKLQKGSWTEIVPRASLMGGSHNYFSVPSRERFTHVRLNAFPDGGVARLRVHGVVKPAAAQLKGLIDVAAAENGAVVITANDMYFGPKDNLIIPGRAKNMGQGWETRRRRGPGHDWLILKLCGLSRIKKIEVDTNHFKGNFPDRCSIDGFKSANHLSAWDFRDKKISWKQILPESKLQANKQIEFKKLKNAAQAYSYLRLNIYPDGGISRLRAWGHLES